MLSRIESDLGTAADVTTVNEIVARWIQAVNLFTGILDIPAARGAGRDTFHHHTFAARRDSRP